MFSHVTHIVPIDMFIPVTLIVQLCAIHFHTVAKDIYFAHSSYYSPKKMTENVLKMYGKTRGQLCFRSILSEHAVGASVNDEIFP